MIDNQSEDEDNDVQPLSEGLEHIWDKRKKRLEHEYDIAGWALSVSPEVREDVNMRMTSEHHDAIESLLVKLHVLPCPNPSPGVVEMSTGKLIDTFWDEYEEFNMKTGKFSKNSRWNSPDVRTSNSHTWHKKYSLPVLSS